MFKILAKFYPNLYVKNIREIPYNELIIKNITGLIFDIDNTIVPYYIEEAPDDIIKFFDELKRKGFKICLLSNNSKERVEIFNSKLKLSCIYEAKKPFSKCINNAVRLLDMDYNNVAIIGDQVFTDILVGNKNKIFTILVKPIDKRDEFTVRLKRGVEKLIIKKYMKKLNKNNYEKKI